MFRSRYDHQTGKKQGGHETGAFGAWSFHVFTWVNGFVSVCWDGVAHSRFCVDGVPFALARVGSSLFGSSERAFLGSPLASVQWTLAPPMSSGCAPHLLTTGSYQAYRAISTGQLSALLHLHLRPIDVVVFHGPQGDLVLRGASRLDAFSGYPVRT